MGPKIVQKTTGNKDRDTVVVESKHVDQQMNIHVDTRQPNREDTVEVVSSKVYTPKSSLNQ